MSLHIGSKKNQISKIVLICGDPLRAKFFSERFLEKPNLVNSVRGMFAFTGKLKSTNLVITIMGHGMGLDSIGIYAYELYKDYDVELIIRFGSCGSYSKEIKLWDLIVATSAWTESNYGEGFGFKSKELDASKELIDIAKNIPQENIHFGKVNSSMWFYKTNKIEKPIYFAKKNFLAVEMEAYALYAIAKRLNRKAITLLTVSDNLVTKEFTSHIERQEGFLKMFDFLIKIVKDYVKKR